MDLLEWVCGILKGKAYEHEGKINHIAATFREGSKWVCWPEKLMLTKETQLIFHENGWVVWIQLK